jgi:phosphopantothenate synthetase
VPIISKFAEELKGLRKEELQEIVRGYDNKKTLSLAIEEIKTNLESFFANRYISTH